MCTSLMLSWGRDVIKKVIEVDEWMLPLDQITFKV